MSSSTVLAGSAEQLSFADVSPPRPRARRQSTLRALLREEASAHVAYLRARESGDAQLEQRLKREWLEALRRIPVRSRGRRTGML